MANFNIYNIEDAPEASKPILESIKKRYGFVPNLLGGRPYFPSTIMFPSLTLSTQSILPSICCSSSLSAKLVVDKKR